MNKSKTHIQVKNNTGYAVNANILVGDSGSFSSGDILDANAVEELINNKINNLIGNATESGDTLGELLGTLGELENKTNAIQAEIIIKELIWRWWYSDSNHPIFLLCDSEGKLLKTSAGRTEKCELSGSVMGQPTSITDTRAALMANSWGTSSRTFNIVAEGVEIDGIMIEASSLVNLPRKVAEFEVLPSSDNPRPTATEDEQYRVLCSAGIAFDSTREYGDSSLSYNTLGVATPESEYPDDPYSVLLWTDWITSDEPHSVPAGYKFTCIFSEATGDPLPASAIWSFGKLVDY